jgi:hypothetical protein
MGVDMRCRLLQVTYRYSVRSGWGAGLWFAAGTHPRNITAKQPTLTDFELACVQSALIVIVVVVSFWRRTSYAPLHQRRHRRWA